MNPLFPIEYIIIFFGGVILLGGYLSWRSAGVAPKKIRILVTALRISGLLTLALIAFDPGYWKIKKEIQDSEWAVMLDSSASMQTEDIDGKSRFDAGRSIVAEIMNKFDDVKIYPFSRNLAPAVSSELEIGRLEADGTATDIAGSGRELLRKFSDSGKSLKGLIIISDGIETTQGGGKDFAILARAENIPINGICLGGNVFDKDIALKMQHTHFTLFEGQSQSVIVNITNSNMGKIKTEIELHGKGGAVIDKKEVRLENNTTQKVTFTIKLSKPGYNELWFDTPLQKDEKIEDNNRVAISATVLDEKLKVLMIEGRPFWDSKFLSQVMKNNKNIDFTGIYRLSPERFFLISDSDSKNEESSDIIFPDSLEKLAEYNLIIFGKGAEFFLDDKKVGFLKRYIRDFGGAVLFARGKPYSGDWNGLNNIEPVYWGETLNKEFRWQPTEPGETCGLFGEMLPDEDADIWQDLPLVGQVSRCPELKSFAEVLLIGKSDNSKLEIPVLISRKIGKGIVLAVNSEGLWKWDFFPLKGNTENFYRKFWTQLVFWSVKYSDFLPSQNYSIHLSRNHILPGEEVVAFINTREKFEKNMKLTIKITKQNRMVREIVPSPSISGRGWNGLFSLSEPGRYRVSLVMPGKSGKEIFASLEIEAPPQEGDRLSADPQNLNSILLEGGGKLMSKSEIIKLLEMPDNRDDENIDDDKTWNSIWSAWWLLLLLLGFFSLECYLRRRNGML